MMHLPEVGGLQKLAIVRRRVDETLGPDDLAPQDSLLGAGEYGLVLHKALELWALDRQQKRAPRLAAVYVREAAAQIEASPAKRQQDDAEQALGRISSELAAWVPERIEAPFTLDFGNEGRPLLVSGYLDLLARDAQGRVCLVDYKTGAADANHALQLALYRTAARNVYALDVECCYIGHVQGKNFSLELVEPVSDEELRRRINEVRDGLLRRDVTPRAGSWCATCGYRAAPCQDYYRKKPE
jgi:ATP-dependent exoDNAse (exonuclease V) beta subunit